MATDRRRRRLQRLTLLFVAFVVLAGGVAGLWVFQQQRQQKRQQTLRTEGLAAHAAGDDQIAAARLGAFVDADPDADPEALLAAAESAYRLPLPGNAHVRRAQQWLMRLREAEPRNGRANELLLEIAEAYSGAENAARIASDVLRADPENRQARLLRASSRLTLDRPDDALEDLDLHLAENPGEAEGSLLRVQARLSLDEPADAVAAEAVQSIDAAADEAAVPGLRLAAAYAQLRAGAPEEAATLLRSAAEEPPTDGRFAIRLARLLDTVNAYPEANAYLIEHADLLPVGDGPGLEVTRRLFEAGRLEEVRGRLAALDALDPPELLAIRAMAEAELGESEAAEATLDVLAGSTDPQGVRWATPLRLFYASPRKSAEVLRAAGESIGSGLRHPYLLAVTGRAQADVDDHAAALSSHRQAAAGRPAWAAPHVLAARALLELDRPAEAEAEATEAFLRRRDLLEPLVLRAEAMSRRPGREAQTLELVQRLREQAPAEPRLVVLEATALAAAGDTEAARVAIEAAVNLDPPLPPGELLQLARVGQEAGLGTESLVLDKLNDAYGDRPELVFARASRMAREGDVPGGLALIRENLDPEQPAWRLIEAAYLQAAGDPAAAEAWAATADAFPERLSVQRRVLQSPASLNDRALADRVIDRIRELAGEQNLQWRLARARWLLERPTGDTDETQRTADARDAEALLDEVLLRTDEDAEALLLRARARERQGSLLQAVRDAEAAMQRADDRPATRLEVARLQQAVGNFPAALSNLIAVTQLPEDRLTPEQSRATALLLASQGEYDRAIATLEALGARGGDAMGEPERLLMAQLYAQVGREDAASSALDRLLAEAPSADAVTWGAGFYAESGRTDDALALLDRLESAGVGPARRRAIRAEHAARYGSLNDALAGYEEAAAAGDPGAAARLAVFNLRQGRGRAAVAAAEAGVAAGDETPGLAALAARGDDAARLAEDPAYRPILERLVTEPAAEQRETLDAAAQLAADPGPTASEKLARLRQLASDRTELPELQTLAAQLHLRAGRNEEALELAESAAIAHPNAVAPAQARALAFFALERYEDALASAIDWRRRSARDPLAADLLIARARLEKGQAREAVLVLEPYRGFADRVPGQMADFAAVYGRALAETGRADEATRFLGERLQLPAWRAAGLSITPSLRDADARSAWLETLTAAVPESEPQERFRLANAWWAFHLAGGTDARGAPDAGRLALRITQGLAERADATMPVHAAAGMMAESLGLADEAISAYRRALELDSNAPAVRNNLAMVLLGGEGGDAIDAPAGLQLAREAVAAAPDNANYRDTLALALVAAGDREEALRTIEVAIELEPANPAWRDRQAEIMRQR